MANINFENIMWMPRENLDATKLANIQKNSDNIYEHYMYNARGILGKSLVTSSVSVVNGDGNTGKLITSINFNIEKNRAIGFGLSAPYIWEDDALSNATATVQDAIATFYVSLNNDSNAQYASARTINLWNDRDTQTAGSANYFDGVAVNMYYINTGLSPGLHTASFYIRNSSTGGSGGNVVGGFKVRASTLFPIVTWIEDLGAIRPYV